MTLRNVFVWVGDAIGTACVFALLFGGLFMGHGLGLNQPQQVEMME
jgi:hypothetical protein